jgi:signal transduction histidine kinase
MGPDVDQSRRRVDPLLAAREAVESLRKSDERFHACVENMLDPFGLFSAMRDDTGRIVDFRIDYLNRAACNGRLRLSLDEHLGRSLAGLLPTFEASGLLERYAGVVETAQPLSLEWFPFDDFFGLSHLSRRWFDIRAIKLEDGLAVAWRDVTDRQQHHAALAEWKARYDAAVVAAGQLLYDWDSRTNDVLITGNVVGILGKETEAITHLDQWLDRVHPDDRAAFEAQVERVALTKAPFHLDYRIRRNDGQYIDVSDQGCFFPDRDGAMCRMVGFVTDVSSRRRYDGELVEKNRQLEALSTELRRSNEGKDRFFAVLSHELRTPLAPVLMGLEALELESSLPQSVRPTLAMLRQNVQLQSRLIDDLLDLTRATRGKTVLDRQKCDIHRLVASAISTCASGINGRRLHLDLDLAAPNPVVHGDAARLTQVLWNLLQNAVKFTPPSGRIRIASANEPGWVRIEISDTGMGIASELLPHIFDPFEQGPAAITRAHGGLGLGLAIAKSLTQLHGGELSAASAGQGQGATFTLMLPVSQAAGKTTPGRDTQWPPKTAQRPLRILVVDDHEHTTRVLSNLLRSLGHSVQCAGTVREAIACAGEHPVDLLISDLGLPDGSGLDLIRELRTNHSFPAIALSGYGMEDDRNASLAAGFSHHLTKPVTLDQLQAAIAATGGQGG